MLTNVSEAAKSFFDTATSANAARFLIEIDGFEPLDFTVTRFKGSEAIGAPYDFEVDFQPAESARQTAPVAVTAENVLGRACRFTLIRHSGKETVYSGMVKEFRIKQRCNPVYAIRLVPWFDLLSFNVNNRVFQKLNVLDIVKKVIKSTDIEDYCEFRYDLDESKYPEIAFCVQYQETDLNFISRLLEYNGIWYYLENTGEELKKDCVVITDKFSGFPEDKIWVPYNEGGDTTDDFGESVSSLESKVALTPKRVRLRTQNHRTPENMPEGTDAIYDDDPRFWGEVNEYGGSFKDSVEAERLAKLYMARLQVENMRSEGRSTCNAFRAGRLVSVDGDANYLLTSVTHEGGVDKGGSYTYNNFFVCIDATAETYAPPLRAVKPRVDGLITAPVDAMGTAFPSIDEMGRYKVRLPFDDSNVEAYCATKNIRLVQPSGGSSDDTNYGIHFPSKLGAEMALACVDGDPDKPIGLGFVPNTSAPSVVNTRNRDLNVIRTWGDNVLAMDDTPGKEKIVLATAGHKHIDNDKRGIEPEAEPPNTELLCDNENAVAALRVNRHKIKLSYNEEDNSITIITKAGNSIKLDDKGQNVTIRTTKGNIIQMNDPDDLITVQNAGDDGGKKINKVVLNGKDKSITLDCLDNTVVVNGQEKRITLESKDSKVAVDGKGKKVIMENKNNKVIINGGNDTITMNAQKDINFKAKGKLDIDTKDGIFVKGPAFKMV